MSAYHFLTPKESKESDAWEHHRGRPFLANIEELLRRDLIFELLLDTRSGRKCERGNRRREWWRWRLRDDVIRQILFGVFRHFEVVLRSLQSVHSAFLHPNPLLPSSSSSLVQIFSHSLFPCSSSEALDTWSPAALSFVHFSLANSSTFPLSCRRSDDKIRFTFFLKSSLLRLAHFLTRFALKETHW